MSSQLLYELNGSKRGNFRRFLDTLQQEPRIAWYPSAGRDFRDLLYLYPGYAQIAPPAQPEPAAPNIYLHSDYLPWSISRLLDEPVVHNDDHTTITIRTVEELLPINLPLDPEIVHSRRGSHATGRVLFLEMDVQSHVLGEFQAPLVYVFAENEALCARKILPCGGQISHVIHVRYGGGCGGGGRASGDWLLNILPELRCEVLITDGHGEMQSGDQAAISLYPELGGQRDGYRLECIRRIESKYWSGHGDVTWNTVIPR